MTPAIQLLEKKKVKFKIYQYKHNPNNSNYGLEAAEYLANNYNVNSAQVFKTLVVHCSNNQLVVAIICIEKKLNLKALAKLLQVKKVKMADPHAVLNSTGYILGGVSPLGQKNTLTTVVDASVNCADTVFVSAGKRGLEIALAPEDLVELTKARISDISV